MFMSEIGKKIRLKRKQKGMIMDRLLRRDPSTKKPIDPKTLSERQRIIDKTIEEMNNAQIKRMTRTAKMLIDNINK